MWVFAKTGFVSIVQDAELKTWRVVRARVRGDLEAFCDLLPHGEERKKQIVVLSNRDYRYRVTLQRREVAAALHNLAMQLDYGNFKESVHGDPDRDHAYMKCWAAMKDLQEKRRGR